MYGRTVAGETLEFGHEGILYRDSFVMYDLGTDSKWVHTTGEAVKGAMKGERLRFLPSQVTTWAEWKREHPKTSVLDGEAASGFMGTYTIERQLEDFGFAVGQGDMTKLYPAMTLEDRKIVHDVVDGRSIVVVFHSAGKSATAFVRGNRKFTWDGKVLRDQDGAEWDAMRGVKKSSSEVMEPVPATGWLIERWRGFYPHGEMFMPDDGDQ